jgi:hypothetical protein
VEIVKVNLHKVWENSKVRIRFANTVRWCNVEQDRAACAGGFETILGLAAGH